MPEEPSDAETAYEVRLLCEGGFEHERRISLIRQIAKRDKYAAPDQTTSQLTILNLVLMGKVPHVVACLLTLVISFSILFFLFWVSETCHTNLRVTYITALSAREGTAG